MYLRIVAALAAFTMTAFACACTTAAPDDVTIALADAPVIAQQEAVLPRVLDFSDRMGAVAVAALPAPLELDEAPTIRHYDAADVAYRAADQSLYVFTRAGEADMSDGLVLIGTITDGLDALSGCTRSCPIRVIVDDAEPEDAS